MGAFHKNPQASIFVRLGREMADAARDGYLNRFRFLNYSTEVR